MLLPSFHIYKLEKLTVPAKYTTNCVKQRSVSARMTTLNHKPGCKWFNYSWVGSPLELLGVDEKVDVSKERAEPAAGLCWATCAPLALCCFLGWTPVKHWCFFPSLAREKHIPGLHAPGEGATAWLPSWKPFLRGLGHASGPGGLCLWGRPTACPLLRDLGGPRGLPSLLRSGVKKGFVGSMTGQ